MSFRTLLLSIVQVPAAQEEIICSRLLHYPFISRGKFEAEMAASRNSKIPSLKYGIVKRYKPPEHNNPIPLRLRLRDKLEKKFVSLLSSSATRE